MRPEDLIPKIQEYYDAMKYSMRIIDERMSKSTSASGICYCSGELSALQRNIRYFEQVFGGVLAERGRKS